MDDLELKRRRAISNRRSIMDIGMGFIYAAMGGFFLLSKQLGINIDFPPIPFNYIFGALCLLYGGFRIYKGFKKNYFRS
jgi:hypothetical protein